MLILWPVCSTAWSFLYCIIFPIVLSGSREPVSTVALDSHCFSAQHCCNEWFFTVILAFLPTVTTLLCSLVSEAFLHTELLLSESFFCVKYYMWKSDVVIYYWNQSEGLVWWKGTNNPSRVKLIDIFPSADVWRKNWLKLLTCICMSLGIALLQYDWLIERMPRDRGAPIEVLSKHIHIFKLLHLTHVPL